jgi:hypothetical protein
MMSGIGAVAGGSSQQTVQQVEQSAQAQFLMMINGMVQDGVSQAFDKTKQAGDPNDPSNNIEAGTG